MAQNSSAGGYFDSLRGGLLFGAGQVSGLLSGMPFFQLSPIFKGFLPRPGSVRLPGPLEPCPGIRSLSEEFFFTESRIVKINEILKVLEQEGWATEALRKKTSQTAESFFQLKNGEITAVSQLARDSSALRSLLQKVYDQTIQARAESSHRWLIGVGVLLFIGVMVLLGVGFKKLNRMGKGLLLFLLIGGSLSFISCSSSPVEPAKKSPAQEQVEQFLSVATQTSSRVEEGFYCSILLAQMAREWSKIDPTGSDRAFQLAWKMALKNHGRNGQAPLSPGSCLSMARSN